MHGLPACSAAAIFAVEVPWLAMHVIHYYAGVVLQGMQLQLIHVFPVAMPTVTKLALLSADIIPRNVFTVLRCFQGGMPASAEDC